MYKIGERLIEIEYDVIDQLRQWNSPPMNENWDMDYRFSLAAFLSLVSPDEIMEDNIDPNAMDFVLGELKLHAFFITNQIRYYHERLVVNQLN